MGDRLLPLSLTERSVHLCVDMQRLFATREVLPLELLGLMPLYPPATVIDKARLSIGVELCPPKWSGPLGADNRANWN